MHKPTLLVVDDDIDVLQAVTRDLRGRYGSEYRIVRASSGSEALELLQELSERGAAVALILSDQRMPGMDGVTFLTRSRDTCPRAKRVLLTAYADTDAAIAAINRSQVHYYLTKPWDPPEERLFPVLDDMLEDWRAGYRPGYGGVRVVGDRWSARCHVIRDFLARNQVPYQFLDVETSDEARVLMGEGEAPPLPLVLFPGRQRLENPELGEIADHIGLDTTVSEDFYDLAIVGAGPGGLAAAVYGGSEGLSTILIEREAPGGQAGTSSRIENYLGFPAGLSGADLARRAVAQARLALGYAHAAAGDADAARREWTVALEELEPVLDGPGGSQARPVRAELLVALGRPDAEAEVRALRESGYAEPELMRRAAGLGGTP
jgi:thioredoxin reductase (NADPH)